MTDLNEALHVLRERPFASHPEPLPCPPEAALPAAPFSAALKGEVLRRWPGALIEYYGMTEGSGGNSRQSDDIYSIRFMG